MEDLSAYYDPSAKWSGIPEHMRGGIYRYVMHGVPMGGFLTAIFENDFMRATGKADDENRRALFEYAAFIYNHTPSQCHGSPERVDAWLERGGIRGPAHAEADA